MFEYPVDLIAAEEGGFVVTFPDLPYGVTEGDDTQEALMNGVSALETVMIGLMGEKQDIPPPSPAKPGQMTVTLPALSAAKVALISQCGLRASERLNSRGGSAFICHRSTGCSTFAMRPASIRSTPR
jgi:predicted RNase H-like HicB family nuclease